MAIAIDDDIVVSAVDDDYDMFFHNPGI